MNVGGLITLLSVRGPRETMGEVIAAVERRGMSVFAHIDHAAAAASVGLDLRPTDLVIFGSPRGGTFLMQSVQTIGIDLPLKVLVWQDETQKTWLTYTDPNFIVERHNAVEVSTPALMAMSAALVEIAREATQDRQS